MYLECEMCLGVRCACGTYYLLLDHSERMHVLQTLYVAMIEGSYLLALIIGQHEIT